MPQFRTKQELDRAKSAQKFQSVAEGTQYTSGKDSPFPIHQYFQNKLLGRQVKMIEVNAGAALVENMVADTITDMKISFGNPDEDMSDLEQEAMEWLDEIDYSSTLEEAARDYYGVGYAVQQPFRYDNSKITITSLDPSTWYPALPTFTYQDVTDGRIICVWDEGTNGVQDWYALVESHTVGSIEYKLLKLDNADSLEGKEVDLSALKKFSGLKSPVKTELDYLAVFQIDHQKKSAEMFGRSVLSPIWDILQEVSEIQTQIRQERIKHFRAKLYAPIRSLQRAENVNNDVVNTQLNSKQLARRDGAFFDMNQEVFPVPEGSTVIPGYIQRDLQTITIGSDEIDKLLSRAAAIVGCPKSVFNIEESAGNMKVDTEKRKDRKYTRRILQGQRKLAYLTKLSLQTWYKWAKVGETPQITVGFKSPFELSQEETVNLMREMNPNADFVSQEEAIKSIWPDMKPEDRDAMLQQIKDEQQLAGPPPNSVFKQPPSVSLNG